jgi:putative flippase GtrA
VRHWGGFFLSGSVAFLVDAGILSLLVDFAKLDPFSARIIAIFCALVVSWLMHRRITFNVRAAPTFSEFLRFAAVSWSAAALNYALYSAILLMRLTTLPLLALVLSSLTAAILSYIGFRLGVFRHSWKTQWPNSD